MFSEPPMVELQSGTRLDRYELLCKIGEGGMAQVWLARMQGKRGFERLVAIKVILPKFASDAEFQKMFLDEARIASEIDSPNVARILDLGEERNMLFLVLEYVAGDSLQRIRRALEQLEVELPVGVLVRVLADTCAGLHAAHELRDDHGALLNIVHRDISPQNILVSEAGVAKLIDFGVAKARDRLIADTSTGLVKGKLRYMAPEQASGGTLDRRADVFAVGAVAYELLEHAPPYDGENDVARIRTLFGDTPVRPVRPSVPRPIAAVIMKAISRTASARYETAAELRTAFEDALIESKLRVTTDDVAAFYARHLGARHEKRRRGVDEALVYAAERARMSEKLAKPLDKTPSVASLFEAGFGVVNVPSAAATADSRAVESAPPTVDGSLASGEISFDDVPDRPARKRPDRVVALGAVALAATVVVGSLVALRNGDARAEHGRLASSESAHERDAPKPVASAMVQLSSVASASASASAPATGLAAGSVSAMSPPASSVMVAGKAPQGASPAPSAPARPASKKERTHDDDEIE